MSKIAPRLLLLVVISSLASLLGCSTDLSAPTARIVLGSGDGGTAAAGARVSLDGSMSTDPNGQPLAYRWRIVHVPPGSHAAIAQVDATSTWLSPDVGGDYTVELVVSDGSLTSAPVTATFTAGPCGAAVPAVSALTADPPAPNAGDPVLLSASVADADLAPACGLADHLDYAWTLLELPKASRATLNDATSQAPSLFTDEPGVYRVGLIVTDAAGHASPAQEMTIAVAGCQTAVPVLASVAATPAVSNAGQLVALSAIVDGGGAPDGGGAAPGCEPRLAYHWALVSVPSGSRAALTDPTLRDPSFVPDLPGAYVAELHVENARGDSSVARSVTVQAVVCGSRPPTLSDVTASPAAPAVGQAVGLGATATDPDTQAECGLAEQFRFAWSILAAPAGSTATLNDPSLAAPSFTPDVAGSFTVGVVAQDSEGHVSAQKTATIVVSACGLSAPVVTAVTASPAAPSTGSTVALAATVTDADTVVPCNLAQTFALTWALATVPAGSHATLSGTHQTAPWFSADLPGKYLVVARATDSHGQTGADKALEITVSTCGNAAPSVTSIVAGPSSPIAGNSVSLAATVTDADTGGSCKLTESFSYAWALTAVPSGSVATLSGTSSPVSGFVPDQAGSYTVALVVTDSEGHASAKATQTVAVGAPGTCGDNRPVARLASVTAGPCGAASCSTATTSPPPPSAPNATAPGYVVKLNGHTSVRLDASGSFDADNAAPCSAKQTLSYSWSILAAPVGSAASWAIGSGATTTMVAPTFVPDLTGVYQLGLVVSDGALASTLLVVQVEL